MCFWKKSENLARTPIVTPTTARARADKMPIRMASLVTHTYTQHAHTHVTQNCLAMPESAPSANWTSRYDLHPLHTENRKNYLCKQTQWQAYHRHQHILILNLYSSTLWSLCHAAWWQWSATKEAVSTGDNFYPRFIFSYFFTQTRTN